MKIHFITGNKDKFKEVETIIKEVEQVDIDLPEIQEIDAKKIIQAKILKALETVSDNVLVEDTSLYIDSLKGLPGPLAKWFLKTIGNTGLAKVSMLFGEPLAQAKTVLGYARSKDEIYFFEGVIKGKIVEPKGELGFGWDPIFRPDGFEKTFGEMTFEEKNQLSMRKLALEELRKFLEKS